MTIQKRIDIFQENMLFKRRVLFFYFARRLELRVRHGKKVASELWENEKKSFLIWFGNWIYKINLSTALGVSPSKVSTGSPQATFGESRTNKTYKTNRANVIYRTNRAYGTNVTDKTNGLYGTDVTNKTNKTGGTDKSYETDMMNRTNRAYGTDKANKTDGTDGVDRNNWIDWNLIKKLESRVKIIAATAILKYRPLGGRVLFLAEAVASGAEKFVEIYRTSWTYRTYRTNRTYKTDMMNGTDKTNETDRTNRAYGTDVTYGTYIAKNIFLEHFDFRHTLRELKPFLSKLSLVVKVREFFDKSIEEQSLEPKIKNVIMPKDYLRFGALGLVIILALGPFAFHPELLFTKPWGFVTIGTPGAFAAVVNTVVIVSSTAITSWTVPDDWNNSSNTIEVIGGGGGGGDGGNTGGGGGGGGAYAKVTNLDLGDVNSVVIKVGYAGSGGGSTSAGSNGGYTWFNAVSSSTCNSSSTCVMAAAGRGGGGANSNDAATVGGAGGTIASSTGATIKNAGGTGGNGLTDCDAGGGGGGAGGPGGTGKDGGNGSGDQSPGLGGGGGGNGGGQNGITAGTGCGDTSIKIAGAGGTSTNNVAGGTGGSSANDTTAGNGGTGSQGSGGGGSKEGGTGGVGGNGVEWTTAGSGGGGGGGGDGGVGNSGGLYGGGGGGGEGGGSTLGSAAGAQGVIIITYSPIKMVQSQYRWYVNTATTTPTSSLAAQNTSASSSDSTLRLRMNVIASSTGSAIPASSSFKLQYQANSTSGAWTDVGTTASTTIWRGYSNAGVTNGVTLPSVLLTSSTVAESYVSNPPASTPVAIPVDGFGEWDWVLENNGAATGTTYYFRMVRGNNIAFANYRNYPQLLVNAPPAPPASPRRPTLNSPEPNATTSNTNGVFKMTGTDADDDYLQYRMKIYANEAGTELVQTNDQTVSQTGWSGQNASSGVAYTSGSNATFTLQTALTASTTYWWGAEAKDPDGSGSFGSSTLTRKEPTWTNTTALPVGITGHSAIVYNGFAYVLGGDTNGSGNATKTVKYARINQDGTIGSWTDTTVLSQVLHGHSSFASDNYLFVVGGAFDGTGGQTNAVRSAPINANGTIGNWTATQSLPTSTVNHGSFVYNGKVYVLGGSSDSTTSTVLYAPINSDGTIGSWTRTQSLPTAMYYHGASAYNGYAYVTGGFNGISLATSTVLYAPINSSGTIGSWATTTVLRSKLMQQASFVDSGYLYLAGGSVSNDTSTVQYAPINSNGTVGSWTDTMALPRNVFSAGAFVSNGYAYLVGGFNDSDNSTSTVLYGQINLKGGIKTEGWTDTSALPSPLYTHNGSFVSNGYAYFVGGDDSSNVATTTVSFAPVNASGTLGTWTNAQSLPSSTRYHSAVAYNGYAYKLGGTDADGAETSTILYAPIASTGTIGTWLNNTTLPDPLSRQSAFISNGYIYVVGGRDSAFVATSTVLYAPINSSGTIGTWLRATALPKAATEVPVVALNDFAYVIGGAASPVTSTVRYAKINSDGSLGSWIETSRLPVVNYEFSPFTYNGYIYVIGGFANGASTSTVLYAVPNSTGSLSSWIQTTAFPTTVNSQGGFATGGYIYSVGGSAAGINGTTTVKYAPIYTSLTPFTAVAPAVTPPSISSAANQTFTVGDAATTISPITVTSTQAGQITTPNDLRITITTSTTNMLWDTSVATATISGTGSSNVSTTVSYENGSSTLVIDVTTNFANGEGITISGLKFTSFGSANAAASTLYLKWLGQGQAAPFGTDSKTVAINSGFSLAEHSAGQLSNAFTSSTTASNKELFRFQLTPNGENASTSVTFNLSSVSGIVTGDISGAKIITDTNANGGADTTWTGTTQLPSSIYAHSSVVSNGYVYEIGGRDEAGLPTSTVSYAPLNSDGTIGSWISTTALPSSTRNHTSFVSNGYMYVIGGHGGKITSTVSYAPLNSDGTLGSWTDTTQLPSSTSGHSSVVSNGYVYEIGGTDAANKATSTVLYAPLNGDGTLGSWTNTTQLPSSTTIHSSVVSNGYVYEIGGLDAANKVTSTVLYAPLNGDGTLGSWTNITQLPSSIYAHSSVVSNGYVYVIGGTDAAFKATSTVLYAPLNGDGTLGSWTNTTQLPSSTTGHSSVVSNGYVYEIGGLDIAVSSDVRFARLNATGTIGSFTEATSTFGAGTVSISGGTGTITFTASSTVTNGTSTRYILVASTTSLLAGDTMSISLASSSVFAKGQITNATLTVSVASPPSSAQHTVPNSSRTQRSARWQNDDGANVNSNTAMAVSVASSSDLLVHLRFEEGTGMSTADSTGNGYSGTLESMADPPTATSGWTANGKFGNALNFDGSDDYVTVPSLTWTPASFTVSFWLKPSNCVDWNQVVAASNGWGAFTFHTTSLCEVYVGPDVATRFGPAQLPANTVTIGQWQMFTYTYDGTQGSFYKNGALLAGPTSQTTPSAWGGFQTGNGGSGPANINGSLDDVRIYSRALTDQEVTDLYHEDPSSYNSHVNTRVGQRLTLRTQVDNDGGAEASGVAYKLQFQAATTTGAWSDVVAGAAIQPSQGLAGSDGNAITTSTANWSSRTFVNGTWHEGTGVSGGGTTLSYNNFTELGYMIDTYNAATGTIYYFRLYNNTGGAALDSYGVYPSLTTHTSSTDTIIYSKQATSSLPTATSSLYYFDALDYTNVATSDNTYATSTASANIPMFNFRSRNTTSSHPLKITWEGRYTAASTTFIEVYRFGSINAWITLDSTSTPATDTDFTLVAYVSSTPSEYYQADGINFSSYFRVRHGSITGSLMTDYVKVEYLPIMSSEANQSFTISDAPTAMSPITITASARTPVVTAANDIRIRIPRAFQSLSPDAIVTQTNLTGVIGDVQDDPESPDGNWWTASDNDTDTVAHVSFSTPSKPPLDGSDLQEFKVWVRKSPGQTGTPSISMDLYENGAQLANMMATSSVTSDSGELFSATWDAALLQNANGSGVELFIYGVKSGGGVPAKATVEIGAVKWNAVNDVISMTWVTSTVVASLGGTASSKVSSTVSYEDDKTLVLNVLTDFDAGDTLTISGLSYSNFTSAAATSTLRAFYSGSASGTPEVVDLKVVKIKGSYALNSHINGQEDNQLDKGTNPSNVELLRFQVAPMGESATTTQIIVRLTGVHGYVASDITNAKLYVDTNGDGDILGGETITLGGAGSVSISGDAGTITFSTSFAVTSTRNVILVADFTNNDNGDGLTASIDAADITANGYKSFAVLSPTGSQKSARHGRPDRSKGGGSGGTGGPPPFAQNQEGGPPDGGTLPPDTTPPNEDGGDPGGGPGGAP